MGFKGPQFTFIRKMNGDIIKERLDRVLTNPAWSRMFPGAFSHHLLALKSDHAPILVIVTKTMNIFEVKDLNCFALRTIGPRNHNVRKRSRMAGRMERETRT
ncbi:hypothetical protein SLA2020_047420 [Shorea laevis]